MRDDDNGCLGRVDGDEVARAISQCPDPKQSTVEHMQVQIETRALGPMLVTCRIKREPRWHRPYWLAVRADRITS
jgi:hypothetical protein